MPGSHAARPAPGRARRRAHDLLREVLLTVAALFGAVCLVMVVLVATLDLGVIVFRTGSMSPTIPTGAAALVRTVPADQVEVGDVVTAPSPLGGDLPVTHRVIATETLDDGTTRLRMRGDANEAEDPFPYDVTEVRRVVASAPEVGFALVELGNPRAMAGVTVVIAALVGWALWPRARHEPRPSRRDRRRTDRDEPPAGAGGTGVVDVELVPETRVPGSVPTDRTLLADGVLPTQSDDPDAPVSWPRLRAYRGTTRTGAWVLAAALGAGLVALGTPAPAAAAPATVPADVVPPPDGTPPPDGFGGSTSDEDRLLELRSSLPLGGRWDLSPGADVAWRVESTVRPPEDAAGARGTLWVSLFAGGPLVERGGVALVIQMCDTGWAADGVTCPGGAREVPADVTGGEARVDRAEVGPVATGAEQAVVVRLRVPAALGDEFQGLDMSLALRFDAFGEEYFLSDVLAALDDDAAGSSSSVLGTTGADLRPAVWAALAVLTGAVALAWARRRRAEHEERASTDAGRDPHDDPHDLVLAAAGTTTSTNQPSAEHREGVPHGA